MTFNSEHKQGHICSAVAVSATTHTQIFKKQRISLSFSEPTHFHHCCIAETESPSLSLSETCATKGTPDHMTHARISFEHLHVAMLKECAKACACVCTQTYVKVSNVLCMGAFRVKSFHAKQAKVSALGMIIRPKLQMVFCCCDNEYRNIVQTRKTSPHHIQKAFAHLCLRHCHRPNSGKLARHESQTGSRVDGTQHTHTQTPVTKRRIEFHMRSYLYTCRTDCKHAWMWMCICEQVARVWPTVYLLVSH